MKNILQNLNSKSFYQKNSHWFLVGICVVFILLRFPSIFEPHWYGDEGIYQVVAKALNDGRILYKEIWDNKPPLLYIIYAIFHGDLFYVKMASLISGMLSVVMFYFLAKKLFVNIIAIFSSTIIFALLFGAPILEGNIANAENFILLPILATANFVLRYDKVKRLQALLIAGILLSVAFLIKTVALFDFVAFFVFILLISNKNKIRFLHLFLFASSFLSLTVFSGLYFLLNHSFADFLSGVFLQNVSYVGEQYGAANPVAILVFKTIVLAVLIVFVALFKNKLRAQTIFIYLWLIFSIYNVFFSDRPYTHYLLVLLPVFSLLLGHFIEFKKKTRIVDIVCILIICFFAYTHFHIYRKNIEYYQNFIMYMLNMKHTDAYQSFFDKNVPRDYLLANFIMGNTLENEKVFLISDSAQIYALSNKLPLGKYIVYYHITYYKNADLVTKNEIHKKKPKFIINTTKQVALPDVVSSYKLKYIMEGAEIYEREI